METLYLGLGLGLDIKLSPYRDLIREETALFSDSHFFQTKFMSVKSHSGIIFETHWASYLCIVGIINMKDLASCEIRLVPSRVTNLRNIGDLLRRLYI